MSKIPSYGKIFTLGSFGTEEALIGDIIVQEKVDGSLFRFGVNSDGELQIGSKGKIIDKEAPDNMFRHGVDYILSIEDVIRKEYPKGVFFYCEYLRAPKHNTLVYDRIPTNHLVLFDVFVSDGVLEGRPAYFQDSMAGLREDAQILGIDCIPVLYEGRVGAHQLEDFHALESYLGGEKVEGVVIKNYDKMVEYHGKYMPLFTKFVRESFKERHQTDWKKRTTRGGIQEYILGFKTEARWEKAVQYLRDNGQLEGSPRDIGKLVARIQEDIKEEEARNIKEELYKMTIQDILRVASSGAAEWYKSKLIESLV